MWIEKLTEADISFAVGMTAAEGWDSSRGSFEMHVAHDSDGCFVAKFGTGPVGMITTTRFANTGWIGNLIVRPEQRGWGIGRALMQCAIDWLEAAEVRTLCLEGDPPGVPLYTSLGFIPQFESPRFRLDATPHIRPIDSTDLDAGDVAAVCELDAAVCGEDRSRFLALVLRDSLGAYRFPHSGLLEGFLSVQPSGSRARIGPWAASNEAAAESLLQAALANLEGRAVVVAVPGPCASSARLLATHGFVRTPSSLRMVRGPAFSSGHPESLYALINGAVG
ncbi:MAG: GNAT family N-acetyltransferase [Acidobacteria bacterium]|nr:GNAT family N-acetyltransferase [Acidobacteriota bacterium]